MIIKNKEIMTDNENKYFNKSHLKSLILKEGDRKISDIQIADSFSSRLRGLMFKKEIEYPLLFEIPQNRKSRYESSIHSCFMRFELILVFIDKNNIIFEIAELKPWRWHVPKKSAKYIIEFDKNQFNDVDLKIGDEIEIK